VLEQYLASLPQLCEVDFKSCEKKHRDNSESRQQLYGVVAVEIMEANAQRGANAYTSDSARNAEALDGTRDKKQTEDQQHVL
jgi:hypothetical protein